MRSLLQYMSERPKKGVVILVVNVGGLQHPSLTNRVCQLQNYKNMLKQKNVLFFKVIVEQHFADLAVFTGLGH